MYASLSVFVLPYGWGLGQIPQLRVSPKFVLGGRLLLIRIRVLGPELGVRTFRSFAILLWSPVAKCRSFGNRVGKKSSFMQGIFR